MEVVLTVRSGAQAGKQIRLNAGDVFRVGRADKADLSFPNDSYMSGEHFTLECASERCVIRDLQSTNGTTLNGEKVSNATLRDGDEIAAGEVTFRVRLAGALQSAPFTPADAFVVSAAAIEGGASRQGGQHEDSLNGRRAKHLLDILDRPDGRLFGLLDAARDAKVLELLLSSQEQFQSLYEGDKAKELEKFAPYLVQLPYQSKLLKTLARDAWGQSWGLYLRCAQPFENVRKHFRQFLLVQGPDGRQLYFRFYDPRVLLLYLPTCNPSELKTVFGPVQSYIIEDEDPNAAMRFCLESGSLKIETNTIVEGEGA